uniref:ATP-binding protein n=1 Tax=Flexithrix dorotheae TaxID=70993 RepID=UPI000371C22D
NPENNERKIYIQDEEVEHSISHSMITAIFEDSGNNFWVGTQNGLNLMDRKSGKFFSFNTEQGLPSSFIIGILEDGKGNLWLSTSNGISKFTPPKNLEIDHLSNTSDWGTFRNYNVNDGLQDNEFSPNAYHKLQNGEMIFGGINGFNIFHPDSIVDNKVVPEVHFTALKIYNEEVEIFGENSPLDRHINWMDKLVLDHNQNGFTIHFTALNFTSPEKVEYAYMLEGLDEKWNEVRNQRFAHYSHIAPGEYIFRVKASNNDGLWNEEGKSLKVIIRPPWYETFWFKLSLILVFSGILFLLVRMRINRLKNETIKLEKMVETRTKELQNKSVELQLLTKKLQAQNEELNSHQEELSTQYEKLEESHAKLKNTQLQLVQAEKMASLGVLTAGIAHEINNPINYIKSGVIGLKRALHDILSILRLYGNLDTKNNFNEKFKEIEDLKTELVLDTKVELSERVLENISNGAIKAAEIIKGLKTFSRMDDGNFVIYDIHDGLESTLLLLHHQFTEDIILQKNYGQIPMVACSPSKINQVFMNLLSNAIQALKGRGTITITTQAYKANHEQENWINNLPAIDETNQYISIIIEDTGFGIDKRTISHIFEPFFTTKDVGEGTGLGLSISLNIIDTHKGKIKVESRAGEGAKFTVILPVEQKN